MTRSELDAASKLGQFGWEVVGTDPDIAVPVLLRAEVRYSPVRIVEQEVIKRYEDLHPAIFKCINLNSYFMTSTEANLMTSINMIHCDYRYGMDPFNTSDVVISIADVKSLAKFFATTSKIYSSGLTNFSPKNIGIVQVSYDENTKIALVPFVNKKYNGMAYKFIPSVIAEMLAHSSESTVRAPISNWDLAYMKMLCVYSNNGFLQAIDAEKTIISLESLSNTHDNNPLAYRLWNSNSLNGQIQTTNGQ